MERPPRPNSPAALGRRRFLQGAAAAGLFPILACGGRADRLASKTLWVSAQGRAEGAPGLVVLPADGGAPTLIPTGFRGHDVASDPLRPERVVMFGRRPGPQAVVVDVVAGRTLHTIEARPGRAFQGHGFFTADGRWLVTTEADVETSEGWLGFYDARDLGWRREHPTHGVGPHEVLPMPDGRTAVVGNGGLLTRPETGAEVLNLETMDSSLAYLDLESGDLLEAQRVREPKASIRHLDVAPDGTVALGVQVQREAAGHDRVVPLCAVHRRGEPLRSLEDGLEYVGAMNDYVGSVAIRPDGEVAGFTSPRGDLALFWRLSDGALLGHHAFADCCGIATSPDGAHFVLTSSGGEVRCLSTTDLTEQADLRRRLPEVLWDNHLVAIDVGPEARA